MSTFRQALAAIGAATLARRPALPAPVAPCPRLFRLLVAVAALPSGDLYEVPLYLSLDECRGLVDDPEAAIPRAGALLELCRVPAGARPLPLDVVADKLLDAAAYVSDPETPYLILDALDVPVGRCSSLAGAFETAFAWAGREGRHTGVEPRRVVEVRS